MPCVYKEDSVAYKPCCVCGVCVCAGVFEVEELMTIKKQISSSVSMEGLIWCVREGRCV